MIGYFLWIFITLGIVVLLIGAFVSLILGFEDDSPRFLVVAFVFFTLFAISLAAMLDYVQHHSDDQGSCVRINASTGETNDCSATTVISLN